MENKFQPMLGGRVGDVRPLYRDHNISKIISVSCGLDTPSAVASGYSTTRTFLDYNPACIISLCRAIYELRNTFYFSPLSSFFFHAPLHPRLHLKPPSSYTASTLPLSLNTRSNTNPSTRFPFPSLRIADSTTRSLRQLENIWLSS